MIKVRKLSSDSVVGQRMAVSFGVECRDCAMDGAIEIDRRLQVLAGALQQRGVSARVVSMPSHELFAEQPASYRESVLPAGVPRVAIEAAHPMSWYRWVGADGAIMGIERYGASAPFETIYTQLGLTVDKLVETAKGLVKR